MRFMLGIGIAAAALLGGCNQEAPAPQPPANAAEPAPAANAAVPTNITEASPLRDWLVGTWSFEATCQTDFIVHFNADGTLDNSGDTGTWALEGNQLVETITERYEDGNDEPVKLNPPETRRYTVTRNDQTHGMVLFQGRNVPILRC